MKQRMYLVTLGSMPCSSFYFFEIKGLWLLREYVGLWKISPPQWKSEKYIW